jgi:YggT family protein
VSGVAVNPFLVNLGLFIYYAIQIYIWIVIIRVLLTWINPNPYSPFMQFLSRAADPALDLARRYCPLALGGLDFSPILAIMALSLLGSFLGRWLINGASPALLLPMAALGLIQLLDSLAWILIALMAARLIMSFVHPSPYNPIVRVVYGLSEPLLAPLRRFLPPGRTGLDWRPLLFLLLTWLIKSILLVELARLVVLAWMS